MADENDLDFDDGMGLDDEFDFDLDPMAKRPPAKNSREAATHALKDASAGFTEDITGNPMKTANNIIKASIPKSLSKETDVIFDIKDKLKDEVTEATGKIRSQASGTIRAMEKILPKNDKVSMIADKLMRLIGDTEETKETGPSKEQIENSNIESYINDAIGVKSDRDKTEELVSQQIERNRFKTATQLSSISATSLESIRKFNNEIASSYFRKSLTLQYKSLFTAQEQLSVIKSGMDTFKNQFETLIHNTSLPDLVKTRNSEILKARIKGRVHDTITDKFYSDDNVIGRVRNNLVGKVRGAGESALNTMTGIRDAADQKDMINDVAGMAGSKSGILGGLVGGIAKSKLGQHLGDRISSSETAQNNIHDIKNVFMDPTAYFKGKQTKAEDIEYDENGNRKLKDAARDSFWSFMEDLTGGTQKANEITIAKTDLTEAVSFDGRAYSSITKVIPGLLSKIYGEVKSIRTGDNKPEDNEITYSHNDDKFKTAKELVADIKLGIKSDVAKDSIYYVDRIIDDLARNSSLKIDDKMERELRKGFMSYVMDGGTLAPSKMIDNGLLDHFSKDVSGVVSSSLNETLVKSKKDTDILDNLNYNFKNLRSSIPQMGSKVDELNKSGNLGVLEDMGLVTRDKITKQASFNNEKYKKLVLEELDNAKSDEIQHILDAKKEEVEKEEAEAGVKSSSMTNALGKLKNARDRTVTRFVKPDTTTKIEPVLKTVTPEEEDALRTQFFKSPEYREKKVTSFKEYLTALGYTTKKDRLKNLIKENFAKARSLDKKLFHGAIGMVKKPFGFGKKRKDDSKDKVGVVNSKVDNILNFLKKDKAVKKAPKKSIFDSDGDGDRDGNWKERLSGFKNKGIGKSKDIVGKVKSSSGGVLGTIAGALGMFLPKVLGMVTKIPKLLFGMSKTLLKLPLLLTKLPGMLGGIMSKLPGLAGGAISGAIKATRAVGSVVGTAGAVVAGTTTKLAGKTIGKAAKAPVGMIKSLLNKFTGPIMKKFGKKAGGKIAATLAAKIAARAVPVLGVGLLAYDSAMIAKDMMSNGTSFKSAVSKQVLGFDLFDDDAAAVDEDGNPIKPDESEKPKVPIATPVVKPEPQVSTGTKPINNITKPRPNKIGGGIPAMLTNDVAGDGISEDSTKVKKETGLSGGIGSIMERGGPYADPDGGFTNIYKNNPDVDFSGLHPAFAKNLAGMANEYYELTGNKIPINAAYRSFEHQLALKKRFGAKAATPGKSPHEFGLAFDTNSSVAEKLDKLGLMRKYGFTRPVGKETWHVEAIGNSLNMDAAKQDPAVAEEGILASLGKGGGGWGSGPKGSNNNRGRNIKYQASIMGAVGKVISDKPKDASVGNIPANNIGYDKFGVGKSVRSTTIPDGAAGVINNMSTENLPGASVDKANNSTSQVVTPNEKPKTNKVNNIDNVKNDLNKIKDDRLIKPMQNNIDLARQANSLLAGMSNSLEQSLNVQVHMLETLKRIEKASPMQIDSDNQPLVETNADVQINDSVRDNKSTLPEPTVNLKRKSNISA